MSKRRRTSSVASRGVDEDESDSQQAPEPSRKKRKMDPMDLAQQLYDTIRNHKKDDGTLLCDAFIRAPKRRQEPAYYEVVTNPIDLLKVQQKLKTDEYEDVGELAIDVELIVSNAKAFYKRTSQEYKDACELWELFISTKNKLMEEGKPVEEEPKGKIILKVGKLARKAAAAAEARKPEEAEDTSEGSTQCDDELNMCEDLFSAVMTSSAEDGRPLHTAFQLLPSKKRYPNYYEVIENPIDLRMIGSKIQQAKYASLSEMEKDLILLTKNACTFNEPGSQIYKDAKTLRKIVQTKKLEIEQGKFTPVKGSERIRSKRLRGSQSLSAIAAALKTEEEDDEDDEETGSLVEGEDPDNPCWQLFNAVKSINNPQGLPMAEPFYKLPSRRYYPDYYKEIRNPMSMIEISKKLQVGHYGTVSEVAGDMNIMFENAKKYNRPDSKLYKDAVKLQKLMQSRVQELLDFDHQYSASEEDSVDEPPTKKSKSSGSSNTTPNRVTRGKYADNVPLKRRLYTLCKCLMNYVCEDGRQPMLMFMEKPSKKIYPDYYDVIAKPIDMLTIQSNIKLEKYNSQEEILADFKLMFSNCRKYNEEGSMIYEDAINLEKVLMEKLKELGPIVGEVVKPPPEKKIPKITPITPKPKKISITPSQTTLRILDPATSNKLRTLYHTIRDYKDPKGRQLSQIFLRLPSKIEYPDYYEVIKKPINLEQISQKLKTNMYDGLDDLCSDFILMFDNACKYNEPDSQIYKDALTLQRVAMQTKLQLRQDEQSVPDVPAAVQELLTSLFTSVYNHQDEEGRCFSDSMQELPEHDEVNGKKVRALSLDLIKRRLDGGQYKRLDQFQEDMFSCFQRARNLSRSDSQVFEDSVELQSYFIRQRDDLCRNGDLLHSPALNYTLFDLSNAVDTERQNKQSQEQGDQPDDDQDSKPSFKEESSSGMAGVADNALSYNQQVYRIGDFIYAEGKERGMDPIILNIQRLWTNQEGQQMLYGNQYYRPNETYHVTTRKFLEKEVFKTEQNVALPLNQVLGRCCVLSVKDYFRSKPEGVDEKDVYVCESRYSARARAFKKIKNWPPSLMTGYKLVPREEVLEPKRIMSVFRQRVEKHKEEIAELEEQEKLEEKQKPNVPLASGSDDGLTYFEQYNTPNAVVKPGDCVYMKADSGKQGIAQVDTIWTNKDGEGSFRGPWVLLPSDLPNTPGKTYYKQEVFLSLQEDTHSINNIVSKCVILEHSEYISCRPTEIPEIDVYVCENIYDEARRAVRELPREGLKKYTHSAAVTQDEIYFFRRLINPPKLSLEAHSQMQATQQFDSLVNSDVIMEDSMDGASSSVGSGDIPQSTITTPVSSKKLKGTGKKLVTGFILYSGEVRKSIAASNPDSPVGEISRIVGNEWRKLPANEKASWEERAARINEETMSKGQDDSSSSSTSGVQMETVFECNWDSCDWQFEDMADCIDHAVSEGTGHVHTYFANLQTNATDLEFQCQWRGCTRTRKTIPPFPNLHRLARHVREVHILKSQGRSIPHEQRSKHYMPSRKAAMKTMSASPMPGVTLHAASITPSFMGNQIRSSPSPMPVQNGVVPNNGRVLEPLFVTVPPRPQKLLHSEAYIKYIEGLTADNRNISNWERQLKASQESVEPMDMTRLPGHWLANGIGNHGNILNALWTLRDFMFKDALGISKHL